MNRVAAGLRDRRTRRSNRVMTATSCRTVTHRPAPRWLAWTAYRQRTRSERFPAGVSVQTPTAVWLVGASLDPSTAATLNMAERWNGSTWAGVQAPQTGNKFQGLAAVSADSAGDVWAAGSYNDKEMNFLEVLHRTC